MPTDKERREVAENLRLTSLEAVVVEGEIEIPFRSVEYALGLDSEDWGSYSHDDVMHLADLIDPTVETCELELTYSDRAKAWIRTFECSRCGKSCDNVYGEDYEYCPYCGRRAEHADE